MDLIDLTDFLSFGQDAVAAVLGICFRLFADPKNADSVVNTAATTVRQACPFLLMQADISKCLLTSP